MTMKSRRIIVAFLVGLSLISLSNKNSYCQQGPPPAPVYSNEGYAALVADGAAPILISNQFKFTEGPAVDKKGNVFFTDQPNNKIWKYSTDGKLTVFLDPAGRSNGMYFDKKGNLIACADAENQLWSIAKNGKVTVLIKDYQGKKLNGPNDVWVHPTSGDIYFTDPYYQRDYWTRKKPDIEGQKVYYLAKGKKEAVPIIENLVQPNGIVGSADGKTLYVADIRGRKTFQYPINANGSLGEAKLFAETGSDGVTLDSQGNYYATGRGVTIYNAQGKQIAHIDVPNSNGRTSNVVFGGKDRNKLFITASEAIYVLDMKVTGDR